PFQAVRSRRPMTHLVTASCRLMPGTPFTITGGPLGMVITVEVGRRTGSEQDIAISPRRTALDPRNETLSAPSGKVASPAGGLTCATPGGMGRWMRARRFLATPEVVVAGKPLMSTGPLGSSAWPLIASDSAADWISPTRALTGSPTRP